MNIFVLNGSPKGKRSNTFKITTAFLDGLSSKQHNINIVNISEKDIQHCRGCFAFPFITLACLRKLRLFLTECCLQIYRI